MTDTTLVRFTNAALGYAGMPVVTGLTLVVDPGDMLALVGANGSGKTTLVKSILGLAEVTNGSLELFGTPSGAGSERDRVGYVPQRSVLGGIVPSTVREVVAAGRLNRSRWYRPFSAADHQAVGQALETVGLGSHAKQSVATLSGGQQRRVLIARALARDPELLILDEPLAGVDHASQEQLADTLGALSRAGTTVVIVLHELGPLAPLVSRIARLREGRLVYDGPVTSALLTALHEDELGRHDHHHSDQSSASARAGDLGLTG